MQKQRLTLNFGKQIRNDDTFEAVRAINTYLVSSFDANVLPLKLMSLFSQNINDKNKGHGEILVQSTNYYMHRI